MAGERVRISGGCAGMALMVRGQQARCGCRRPATMQGWCTQKGYGPLPTLGPEGEISPGTVFEYCPVSKQSTGTAVMMLVGRG